MVDLAENIFNFGTYVYEPGSVARTSVVTFVSQLTSYGDALMGLRGGEDLCEIKDISRKWPDAMNIIDSYTKGVNEYNRGLQDLVGVCEAAMPRDYRGSDGSIRRDACLEFTRTLLGESELMNGLIVAIRDFRSSYDRDFAPFLQMLETEKKKIIEEQEIIEDRRRRREEHTQREEHAQRRERHRHSRHS